jgi:hypothetical protein
MRRPLVLALVYLALTTSAFGQSVHRREVSAGWQMLPGEDEPLHGWYGDVAVDLNPMWALVGAIDGLYATIEESAQAGDISVNLNATSHVHTFLGGARFTLRTPPIPRIVPFAEILGGAARVSSTSTTTVTGLDVPPDTTEASDTHSALQIGIGVTVGLNRLLEARVAVAHRRFFLDDDSDGATRVAVGAAVRF